MIPGEVFIASATAAGSPVTRTTVKGSGPVVLNAVLKDESSGSPVGGVPIVAETRDPATFAWSTVAEGRTGADGVANVRFAKPTSTTYRIRPTSVGTPAQLIVTVKPAAPGKVRELKGKAGRGQAELKWKRPSDSGGSAVTKYKVQWRKAGKSKWTSKSRSVDQRSYVIRKLTAGVKYEYRVRAVNAVGSSSWSKGKVTPKR